MWAARSRPVRSAVPAPQRRRARPPARPRAAAGDGDGRPAAPRPPPPAIAAARAARTAGLAASGGLLTAGLTAALLTGVLPPPPAWVAPAAAAAALGDRLVLAADAEGLHVDIVPPYDRAAHPAGRPDARPSIAVRPTPDRGNGAFATAPIPAGAWVGTYEGELLDEAAFWARYGATGGAADYCMRIDRTWTVDGAGRAADTSVFSPCHINHGREALGRANVRRVTRRAARRVDLYASRDIGPGEELCLDYGALYWRGREEDELV